MPYTSMLQDRIYYVALSIAHHHHISDMKTSFNNSAVPRGITCQITALHRLLLPLCQEFSRRKGAGCMYVISLGCIIKDVRSHDLALPLYCAGRS